MRKMNDQFINYEAESAQLADKLSTAKNQLDSLEQEHRELKVCYIYDTSPHDLFKVYAYICTY